MFVYLKIYKQENKNELILGHYSNTCTTLVSKQYCEECKSNFKHEVTYNDDEFMLVKLYED